MDDDERLSLVMHKYWHHKLEFSLKEDTYDCWTMFVVERGRFEYSIAASRGVGEPGDVVICPPEVPFGRSTLEPLSFHFIQFHYPNANPDTFPYGNVHLSFRDQIRSLSTLHLLRHDMIFLAGRRRIWKEQLINDLKTQLEMERFFTITQSKVVSDPMMAEAAEAFKRHYASDLQLRQVAEKLELTPVQLTRRFRSAYGVTPTDFVINLRLKHACRLLTESKLSIDEIAQDCGYENGFYLSRIFLKKVGMRPSEYRKRHQV